MLLLRESSKHSGAEIDFNAILGDAAGDVGIPHADLLVEFTEAVWGDDDSRLDAARRAVVDAMGEDALVDASGIIAMFNSLDRVADATGTPLEEAKMDESADLRADLGINDFEPGNA